MRFLGPVRQAFPEPPNMISTWWVGLVPSDGVEAADEWATRNISSTTSNGSGDVTLTFAVPYSATPYACGAVLRTGVTNTGPTISFQAPPLTTSARVWVKNAFNANSPGDVNIYVVFGGR